jgi:hypothetical protein
MNCPLNRIRGIAPAHVNDRPSSERAGRQVRGPDVHRRIKHIGTPKPWNDGTRASKSNKLVSPKRRRACSRIRQTHFDVLGSTMAQNALRPISVSTDKIRNDGTRRLCDHSVLLQLEKNVASCEPVFLVGRIQPMTDSSQVTMGDRSRCLENAPHLGRLHCPPRITIVEEG